MAVRRRTVLFVQMGEHGQCCKDSNECLRKWLVLDSTSKTGAFVMPRWSSKGGVPRGARPRRPVGAIELKGTRWMSWRQEAMKDAVTCEKSWGAGKRAEIQECPNGATQPARVTYP